jgi:uncharacterized iron-regulated membrane protein
MEIAAGWAIILVITGVFLWWPRGRSSGVITIRGKPRSRTFWRDLHAVTGVFAGAVILFLAVTGMPWSMFWGEQVQVWATANNLSRPAPPAEVTPDWMMTAPDPALDHHAHSPAELKGEQPWALEQASTPQSHATHATAPTIGIDRALQKFEELGVPRPFKIALPERAAGAYSATYTPPQVEDTRIVYLDQFTGEPLGDVGFAEFGSAAQVIEWGIAVHQGDQFGEANRYLMLAGCLAIIVLTVSAATMWWKRRPSGSLGVPPLPNNPRVLWTVVAVIAIFGIIYPLTGLSFLAMLAADLAHQRWAT